MPVPLMEQAHEGGGTSVAPARLQHPDSDHNAPTAPAPGEAEPHRDGRCPV